MCAFWSIGGGDESLLLVQGRKDFFVRGWPQFHVVRHGLRTNIHAALCLLYLPDPPEFEAVVRFVWPSLQNASLSSPAVGAACLRLRNVELSLALPAWLPNM